MIKPAPNHVLIEPIDEDTKTSKGVYLPETSKDKPSKGKVVAVGSFMKTESVRLPFYEFIRDAKTIVHKKWVNQTVDYDGKQYLLVSFSEVLGVIE